MSDLKVNPHAHHMGEKQSVVKTSAKATFHCLTGCVIGEVIGLALGVSLGWPVWLTITVAVILAYFFGFALAIPPIMKREGLRFKQVFKAVWLGESISIGMMEVVMNGVDLWIGGVQAMSLADPIFYIGLAVAIPVGFLATWPINYFMLKKEIKQECH